VELRGIGVSPGIALGHALVVEREAVPVFRVAVAPAALEPEVARLQRAVEVSREQLQCIRDRLARELGRPHAYIFDAHLLMLEDPLLLDRAVAMIRDERVNAEWALRTVADDLQRRFDAFGDPYLRERGRDLDDVLGRIQINLGGAADAPSLSRLPESVVLVASDLTPSDAAELDWKRILGVAIDAGSSTYHTAILARSFGVPAVVGLQEGTRRIPPGSLVVVDGSRGRVVVEPSAPTLEDVREAQERDRAQEQRYQETRVLPAVTRDGVTVRLQANVEFPEEADSVGQYGAEGIGLFRSEYLLGRTRQWPSEERQLEAYRRLLEQSRPHPVTVRTWDVGPEDLAPGGPTSPNPALGQRALRLLPNAPQAFRGQMRALLRAAAEGPIRIMFPFVAGPSDLETALRLLEESRESLRKEGLPAADDAAVGLNLEVPSALLTVDLLAPSVRFFSVGTNDLIQYLLAADRLDPRVSAHYQPLHPAVLRLIQHVVEAAGRHGRPVSVCGEMAADPLCALALLGLGVRELSMSPAAIPRVKAAVRGMEASRVIDVVRGCLDLPTAEAIESRLRQELADSVEPGSEARLLIEMKE
jgi:phosphoenolpyruvate-protein phosphotransferase (PTS system enzyme I)